MADKKDSTPSIVDFVASLVSKSDSRGVDSTRSSVVKDKTGGGSLSSDEESKVDKIATRFGKILKVGAFAEGPEAKRNVGTSNIKGTGAIKDKVEGISTATKSKDSGGLGSFLGKLGIAAAVIGGLLLAFKDNEAVQKVLAKFGEVFSFLSEKFTEFIDKDWTYLDVIGASIVGVIGSIVAIKLISLLGSLALALPLAAIGIAIMVASLYALGKVLPMFVKIEWDTVKKAGAALGGLGAIGIVVGKFGLGTILKGVAGLGLLTLVLWGVSKVLREYETIEWDTITKAGVALVGLGVIGALAGVFAPKLLLGALAIGALGLALIPFAYAADLAAPAIEKIIGAFSDFYGNILEKMPPIIKEIGILITGVIDSVSIGVGLLITTISTGITNVLDSIKGIIKESGDTIVNIVNGVSVSVTGIIDSLSSGITTVLDSIKGIIKESGDTIVNIANGVSDSISRFFERLADTVLKLNGVDTDKLKQIGPALSSIGKGLLEFGGKGLIGEILTGIGSLFGADSPLEKFEKLGEVAPKIQSIPKALEELSKYKNLDFLNKTDIDNKKTSIDDLNEATWKLKGTLDKFSNNTFKKIKIDLSGVNISVLDKINSSLLNLISSTNNLKNTSLASLTDNQELNLFGVFSDNKTVSSINNVNSALLNLLDTQEKLKANSKDLENIRGSFDIKTLNTVSDTNIKNLTADTTEYHSFAKTAMNDQIKRQDVMIDLLRQLVMKPTGGASINTNTMMQQDLNKTFDIRDQFNPYTTVPNNLLAQ